MLQGQIVKARPPFSGGFHNASSTPASCFRRVRCSFFARKNQKSSAGSRHCAGRRYGKSAKHYGNSANLMKKNVSIPAPKNPLSVEVVIVGSGSIKKTISRRIVREVRASARKIGFTRGTISIVLVSRSRMRLLNLKFRGKNNATDVLAFPYIVKKDSVVADIILCPNVLRERLAGYGAHGKNFYSGLAFIVA